MTRCKLCKQSFKVITNTHLKAIHNCDLKDYTDRFSSKDCGFKILSNKLPRNDVRYKNWLQSLKKRPAPWSKGHTRATHPGLAKTSRTFKDGKIDNFKEWREEAYRQGLFMKDYPPLERSGNLAELIGVILGDGHLEKFPRTEFLGIFSNANNPGFIKRYAGLVRTVFDKKPVCKHHNSSNCVKISIYQKDISKRLGIPTGARKNQFIKIPIWILTNRAFLKRYLRGLYEAEGCFCVHKPTCTYKLIFTNRNESLLDNVYQAVKILGFHPHRSQYKIQVSRREEVYKLKELIKFRKY